MLRATRSAGRQLSADTLGSGAVLVARLVCILFAIGASTPASPCSVFAHPTVFNPELTYFSATGTPEMVSAPLGDVSFEPHPTDHGSRSRVYGQIVEIGEVLGHVPSNLKAAITGSARAILVPWGHLGDCTTIPRAQQDPWAPIGVAGAYHARLRRSEHWANGLPTFDIFFYSSQPYLPEIPSSHPGVGGSTPLTISEYLRFIRSLPDTTTFESNPRLALQQVTRIQRDNPTLVSRYPAKEILEQITPELAALVAAHD